MPWWATVACWLACMSYLWHAKWPITRLSYFTLKILISWEFGKNFPFLLTSFDCLHVQLEYNNHLTCTRIPRRKYMHMCMYRYDQIQIPGFGLGHCNVCDYNVNELLCSPCTCSYKLSSSHTCTSSTLTWSLKGLFMSVLIMASSFVSSKYLFRVNIWFQRYSSFSFFINYLSHFLFRCFSYRYWKNLPTCTVCFGPCFRMNAWFYAILDCTCICTVMLI